MIRSTVNGFAVSIEAGCNGIEATIVLVAAIFAFPAPWRDRLIGLAAGIVAVQGLNIVRVISLFYLGQWNMQVFEWAHLYVWQALIMLDVLVVWLVWVRLLPQDRGAGRAARRTGGRHPRARVGLIQTGRLRGRPCRAVRSAGSSPGSSRGCR